MAYLSFLISFIFLMSSCFNKSREWRVGIVGVPSKISTTDAQLLTTSYILKQTHEPLFNKDKNGNFTSHILNNWSRSIDYRQFQMCITEPKYFRAGQPFLLSDLESLINVFLKNKNIKPKIVKKVGNCLEFYFLNPYQDILEHLSMIDNSPTQPSEIKNVENGLGDYTVVEFDKTKVKLVKKNSSTAKLNEIIFYNIEAIEKDKETLNKLDDFNHLFLKSIVNIPKDNFYTFDYTPLKEYVLLLNIQDINVRKALFNCVNINKLRESAYTNESSFIDISTLYPIGIKGGNFGQVKRECNSYKGKLAKPIVLKIWDDANTDGIISAFEKSFDTDVKNNFVIQKEKYTQLVSDLVGKKYDLFLMVVDTKNPSYIPFFDYIFDSKKSYMNVNNQEYIKMYNEMTSTFDLNNQLNISKKLQSFVFDNYYVLPIYQPVRRFYYPKSVTGVFLLEDFLDFPKLNGIEF